MKRTELRKIIREVIQDTSQSQVVSQMLDHLASNQFKRNLGQLADTIGDNEKFGRIKKLYDALYEELKKYDV